MAVRSAVEYSPPRENIDDHPLLAGIAEGIDYLRERGALSFGRAYVAGTRASAHRLVLAARSSGVSATAGAYLIDDESADPVLPATLAGPFAVVRALLDAHPYRSVLLVPAPHLTAFAVAGLPLPIVYGSGLLRRTPVPLPVVPWTETLEPVSVLAAIEAHPLTSAVLLAHRGVLAYSDEPVAKLAKFVAGLEESAHLTVNAHLLGGARALPPEAYEQMKGGIAGD